MSQRLFAAIKIPEELWPNLQMLQHGLRAAKWRPAQNFHITLQFFGEVPAAGQNDLLLELSRIEVPALSLRIAGMGAFGGKKPFAVWAAVQPDASLQALHEKVNRAAKKAGLALTSRKYTPHITLAYCEGASDKEVAKYLQLQGGFAAFGMQTSAFNLFSSHLGKGPALYCEQAGFNAKL